MNYSSSNTRRMYMIKCLLLSCFLSFSSGQKNEPDFKHELPPGVELVDPKDFGLTDDQLGGLLTNVKVLGGSQIGDTKTQILSVGFEGDEELNFDDFEIPGITDKKPDQMTDKEKEIATVAFEKFKEFFKEPKKTSTKDSKTAHAPQQPISNAPPITLQSHHQHQADPRNHNKNPPHQQNHQRPQQHQQVIHHQPQNYYQQNRRPTAEMLQQHYPVTLTRPGPIPAPSPPPPPPPPQHRHQVPVTKPINFQPQNQVNHHNANTDNHNNNHRTAHYNPSVHPPQQPATPHTHPQSQSPPPAQIRQSSHAIAFANNNQPSHPNNNNVNHFELQRDLIPPAPFSTTSSFPNTFPTQNENKIKHFTPFQNQLTSPTHHNHNRDEKPQALNHVHYNTLPPGNFQRFTLYPPNKQHVPPTAATTPVTPTTTTTLLSGKVVRNQLLYEGSGNTYQEPVYSPRPPEFHNQNHQHHQGQQISSPSQQEYRTIPQQFHNNHHPQSSPPPLQNPSALVPPLLSKFPPDDPEKGPVSHIYIQQGNNARPIQQTSFHPKFEPPTRFVNDFTPSLARFTTPAPHIDVTPSMPMILISTNENAITDPKRMELLRLQQKAIAEKRFKDQASAQSESRQKQSHSSIPHHHQPTLKPHDQIGSNDISDSRTRKSNPPPNPFTQSKYQEMWNKYNSNNNKPSTFQHESQPQPSQNRHPHQNSFNFEVQQQQHQLHTLQYNSFNHLRSSSHNHHHHQPYAQPSNNRENVQHYSSTDLVPPPLPPRLPHHFPPHHSPPYMGTRRKRGYRLRLSSLLKSILGDREWDY